MAKIPSKPSWTKQFFGAQSVRNGGVVRRSVSDVKKIMGVSALKAEVRSRGFHLIRTGNQYVVLCHKGDLRVLL